MNKEDLRKVEVHEKCDIKSLPGPGQYVIGADIAYYDGLFHGWDSNGDLKGIVEIDGVIHLVPYAWIKFID